MDSDESGLCLFFYDNSANLPVKQCWQQNIIASDKMIVRDQHLYMFDYFSFYQIDQKVDNPLLQKQDFVIIVNNASFQKNKYPGIVLIFENVSDQDKQQVKNMLETWYFIQL